MTTSTTTVRDVLDAIDANVYTFNTERELQDGLAIALHARGLLSAREVILSGEDRIDLLCGAVGIEVKTKGSWIDALRQCQRYARHEAIEHVVLVTTVPKHLQIKTNAIGGKPLTVHMLGVSL